MIAVERLRDRSSLPREPALAIFYEFLVRLTFGLAVGMALTSPARVTSGFYRNHLYVTFGLAILAALAAATVGLPVWPAALAALSSYVGSICWLYEGRRPGKVALWMVAVLALCGAWLKVATVLGDQQPTWSAAALAWIVPISSGLVLGLTLASMLLGHWYLNAPEMDIQPLTHLLRLLAAAMGLQMFVVGLGLTGEIIAGPSFDLVALVLLALRWLFGLAGGLILVWMAAQTLKIPNTQSATGILYVALVAVFVGELSGLLLSAHSLYPL